MARIVAERLDGDLDVVLTRKIGAQAIRNSRSARSTRRVGHTSQTTCTPRARRVATSSARSPPNSKRCAGAGRCTRRRARRSIRRVALSSLLTTALPPARQWSRPCTRSCQERTAAHLRSASGLARGGRDGATAGRRIVCLHTPMGFYAISQFYDRFPQVEDEEVVSILRDAAKRARPARRSPAASDKGCAPLPERPGSPTRRRSPSGRSAPVVDQSFFSGGRGASERM